MKTNLIVFGILIIKSSRAFAATEFNMTFGTTAPGGEYNPANYVSVWVTQTNGTIVKTILRYGETHKTSLTMWSAADGASVDGYMGATRPNHSAPATMTATWNLKNKSNVVVPDGTYIIKFEMADKTIKTHSFNFVKDSVAGTRTNAGNAYFKNISIAYAPPAASNTAPVAIGQSVTTAEDTAKAIALLATDADSNTLTYAVVTGPAHGALSAIASNVLIYTPATNYYGADSFTFRANDASLTSTPATVSITVTAVNDAPLAQTQNLTATNGNPLSITLNATDAETNALTYNLVSQPVNGHLLGTPPLLNYAPIRGLNATDSFSFNVFDGALTGNTAAVSISLSFADSNSNGIPNTWESAYGITNAVADQDGDGASNYAEYMAGTDPTNRNSVFAITVPQIGISNVVINWSSVQYRFYNVWAATNLVTGWNSISSNNLATPPQNSYTGTYNPSGPTFYQIKLEP